MAFTLGFHIILASLGVAFPVIMLIANYRGLRRDDADALLLAQRWSKVAAVTFAVGAVTGTVLSFEFGLLWPAFTGRFGERLRDPLRDRGHLLLPRGDLPHDLHLRLEAPVRLDALLDGRARRDRGDRRRVLGRRRQLVDEPAAGLHARRRRRSPTSTPLKVIFNPAVPYEVPHMILAAYLVTGFLIASVYAVGMLRGRRDRYHRLGLMIPLTVASIATPIQFAVGDTAARSIADDQPVKFAAMECVQKTSTHVTEYIYGRCTSSGVKGGIGIPGFDSFLVGWSTDTQGDRPRHGASRRPAAREHDAPLGLRHDGGDLHGAHRAGLLVRLRLVAQARPATDQVVPARRRGVRRVGDRGAGVRLDRDRGRPPALGRLRGHAHEGRGHRRQRRLGHVLARVPRSTRCSASRTVLTLQAMARRWRAADEVEEGDVPYGPRPSAPAAPLSEEPR